MMLATLLSGSVMVVAQQPTGRAGLAAPVGPQLLHPMFQDHARPAARPPDQRSTATTAPGTDGDGDARRRHREARAGRGRALERHAAGMAAGGPYMLTASANGETTTRERRARRRRLLLFRPVEHGVQPAPGRRRGGGRPDRDRRADPPAQRPDQRQPHAAPDLCRRCALGRRQSGDGRRLFRGLLLLRARTEEDGRTCPSASSRRRTAARGCARS